jgi:hypothetical protein
VLILQPAMSSCQFATLSPPWDKLLAALGKLECLALQVISFKSTALFKRGIWLSAAALIACVAAPFVLDGSLWRNPVPHLFGACALGALFVYFLRRTQIHRLADEVIDCEDHLKIRRGRTVDTVPFSHISAADVSSGSGIHRITIHLRSPAKRGAKIEFLPQASLWSNLPAVQRVAANLTNRASQAHEIGISPAGPR